MEFHLLAFFLCVTGITMGYQSQRSSPSTHNRISYQWYGGPSPAQSGALQGRSLGSSVQQVSHVPIGQSSSKPIIFHTSSNNQYSSNGTHSTFTSYQSGPIDLLKLFPPSLSTSYNIASKYGQQKPEISGTGNVLSFKVTPPRMIPFGAVQPDFDSINKRGRVSIKPTVSHQRLSDSYSRSSFEFPSSQDLDDVWESNEGKADEKTVEERSATLLRQSKRFVLTALDSHNAYRKKHHAPNLFYSLEIAKVAQAWADKLIAGGGGLVHRPNNKYGENLWMGRGYNLNDEGAVRHAVSNWYDEVNSYKPYYGREPDMSNFGAIGHFTQLVWHNTTTLGMGVGRKGNLLVVVANYAPRGNFVGHFHLNVNRP